LWTLAAAIIASRKTERISAMTSTTDRPPGCARADCEAASTPAARPRARRAAAAICALAAAAAATSALAQTAAPHSAATPSARLAASHHSAPMIALGSRHTTLRIGLFTAAPSRLPAAGGQVKLTAVVAHASSCTFTLAASLGRSPVHRACGSGKVTALVTLPRNRSTSDRSFRFSLTATGGGARTSAAPVTVIEAAASRRGAPQITLAPASAGVAVGGTVRLSAAARGTPKPTVRWQVSENGGRSWAAIAGAKSGTYVFAAQLNQIDWEYRAVFTNSKGSVATTPARIIVQTAALPAIIAVSIVTAPASVSVASGASATFTAAATGQPAPTAQWQISSDGGGSWTPISGATSTSYTIGSATLTQSGDQFRAIFTNQAGSVATSAATLTVIAPSQAPRITTQPINQGVFLNQSATFTAAASGQPAPTVQWQESSGGGGSWTPISGATSTSYTTGLTLLNQTGEQFRAVFTNSVGSTATSAAVLTVSVSPIPPAITTEPTAQTVIAGQTATFTSAATGTPTPTVQWYGSTNGGGSWAAIAGATAPTYSFVALASQSGEEFEAVYSGTNGQANATTNPATLTVETAPQVTVQPQNQSVASGSGVSFSSAANGSPTPTVQWQISTDNGSTFANISGATVSTYNTTVTGADNGFEYQAVFTNAAGTATSNAATVTIVANGTPPQITEQPSNLAVVAGETVSFSAGASGAPTPSVQWQVSTNKGGSWGNVSGATSPTYTFSAQAAENGDQYRAVFSNGFGGPATTGAASLVVGGDSGSANWSGYEADESGTKYTMVTGSWIVPPASCPGAGAYYSSDWVGIDGATSSTVEQDGTESDCASGSPSYYAWWEFYPAATQVIGGDTVLPGDSMTASVSVSGSTWTLGLQDSTQGWTFSINQTPAQAPDESSAEWIVERPSLCSSGPSCITSLADFGTTGFSGASATANGVTGSISTVHGAPAQMEGTQQANPHLLALPSPLGAGGNNFTDTWYASS
jgi:hypothetical protein